MDAAFLKKQCVLSINPKDFDNKCRKNKKGGK